MLDPDSDNVTKKIQQIVGCLDSCQHLFVRPNHNPGFSEDICMWTLSLQGTKQSQVWLIKKWVGEDLIDIDQLVFVCAICGISPRDLLTDRGKQPEADGGSPE